MLPAVLFLGCLAAVSAQCSGVAYTSVPPTTTTTVYQANGLTLGAPFTLSTARQITGVRFFLGASFPPLTLTIGLYLNTNQATPLIQEFPVVVSAPVGGGFVSLYFTTPLNLAVGTAYTAAVFQPPQPNGNVYYPSAGVPTTNPTTCGALLTTGTFSAAAPTQLKYPSATAQNYSLEPIFSAQPVVVVLGGGGTE